MRYRLKIKPDGTSETVPFTAEEEAAHDVKEAAATLEDRRAVVISGVKVEGAARLSDLYGGLSQFQALVLLELLEIIFRSVANASHKPALTTAEAIAAYAKQKIAWAKDPSRTQAELDAYNAATDPGWP